jgi:hypothetical protein
MAPLYPSLYQVNTCVYLGELGRALGRPATLDDWPDAALDRLVEWGFDWLWPLGVWQLGEAALELAPSMVDWPSVQRVLPDLAAADMVSSPFAITSYTVNKEFGGDAALAGLRERLRQRGIRLMLDFVPNHTALDHPWVHSHPHHYIRGTREDLDREPKNYCVLDDAVFAYGRDPYFPGWPDTVQLNYRHPAARAAMTEVLCSIASRCDGVRCDMAMLVLPDVFNRTWGQRSLPEESGPSSSRGSTTPTTSGCTTGCTSGTPAPCAATCAPTRTTSGARSGSSKTTTSRGRPRRSTRRSIARPPW